MTRTRRPAVVAGPGPSRVEARRLLRGSLIGLGLLAVAAFAVSGQEVIADVPSDLEASLVRSWAGDGVTTVDGLVEVPLAILAGGATGAYRFEVLVNDADGTQLFRDSWTREVSGRAAAYAETDASSMLESFSFGLRPGEYEIEILAYPTDAADLGVRQSYAVSAFAERPMASDLFLATRVEPLEESGGGSWSVSRGGFGISATAQTVILEDDPNLFYYLELYGGEADTRVEVGADVRNDAGASLYRTPASTVEVPAGGQAFTGRLPLDGLPPGEYELVMTVGAGDGGSVTRSAPFSVRSRAAMPVVTTAGMAELADYFASLSDAELEDTFGGVETLLTDAEGAAFKALPPDAKRRYLTDFFYSRDPLPETPGNPFLDEYTSRLATVRARYSERVGTEEMAPWLTDRGWIYMRLGEPQNRVVNYYPSGSGGGSATADSGEEPPYEIWQYQDTGYIYLFIEDNRFGAWSLIMTTDLDIPSRADWARRIGPEARADLQNYGIVPGP
ncbi:MAG: GWxTD domain-containing protein [marine benthic group bacterium]|jgi:GWxTD domain-containing protein|nr:GWxTD domain-containing protein [Candidatus Carthagonibacter metallireducens]MCL7983135.1 GWxTD domain-containing protein [Gemmatimonadota bacterium]MCL7985868.1 GWxTD domain-containing protein [Gemmatimonadota bacterium]MCL7991919.1 GWxTD domain-containing protein [Gemmatimonadota bacterium]